MKRTNHSFVLFTALLLVFTLVWPPMPAWADEGDTGTDGDFSWVELADGTVSVTGYTGLVGAVVIPGTLSGRAVTAIADNAFNGNTSLAGITIPDSVTTIGERAFYECSALASVTLPNSLTSIGDYTFCRCFSLTGITIPEGVTSIGGHAFEDCTALASVTLPNSLTSIGNYTFYGCSSLTGITIPDGVTSIGEDAFEACTALASVTLPNSLTSIGDYTFSGCSSLTGITIPDGVRTIGEGALQLCTNLASVTLSATSNLTSIGYSAFGVCTSLTGITIPDSVTSIGDFAFSRCSSLSSITIPDSMTSIEGYVFYRCSSLTDITIPNKVTSIGDSVFQDCSNLAKATILTKTTTFGTNVFTGTDIGADGIYGYGGSTAQSYATANSIPFHPVVTHTVSFDSAGGSPVADVIAVDGYVFSAPAVPTRTGHTFDGWYKESDYTTPWIFTADTVTADTTLYAKWTASPSTSTSPRTYTVTYDSRGGSAVPSQTAERYTTIKPPTDPERTGYAFGGWYTDAACTEVWDMVTGRRDMTVYAKWSPGLTLYLGGRGALTPETPGGAWAWDSAYISLTQNQDSTVTVKGLQAGTTTVTYTIDGVITEYQVTILASSLPPTGQNGRPVYILLVLALGLLALAIGTKYRGDRTQRVF